MRSPVLRPSSVCVRVMGLGACLRVALRVLALGSAVWSSLLPKPLLRGVG